MALVMLSFLRRWWRVIKAVVLVAVVFGVGWHLVRLLQNRELGETDPSRSPAQILWDATCAASPVGLAASGVLYLAAFCCCAGFWIWLTRGEGDTLPVLPGARGYFLSQLGKYAPGKGLALAMRTTMAAEAGCRPGAALLTAVYETLTTMAAGGLVAAILLLVQGGNEGMLWKAVALVVLAGVPVLPGVFNRVVERILSRSKKAGLAELPKPGSRALLIGLGVAACNWALLGASLEVMLRAMGVAEPAGLDGWMRSTTFIAVAYVAGFIASTPGGLGVREFLLAELFRPQLGSQAVVVALLLRLLWTVAELVMAAIVWWLPRCAPLAPAPSEYTVRGLD